MSYKTIRKLIEVRLNSMPGVLPTAFENVPFTPTNGVAYQRVNLLPAKTENPTFGDDHRRELGNMQITLCYPTKVGPAAAMTQAELVREHFKRGLTLTDGAVRVLIHESPYIGPAQIEGVWYELPVTIPYQADIGP